jgi:hypothetical protein
MNSSTKVFGSRAALSAAVVLLAGGCGGGDKPTPTATAPPAPIASISPGPSPSEAAESPAESPSPTPDKPLRLGAAADLDAIALTVFAYREGTSNERSADIASSEKWASIDVRICNNTPEAFEVRDNFWTLQSAESVEYEKPKLEDLDLPQQPVYGGRSLRASKCTRGWISFIVQRDQSPVLAIYANEKLSREWTLKR